jgi:hypothetical protein
MVFLYEPYCAAQNSNCPILVLATNVNFGTYTAEILKAEGFNEYKIDSLTDTKVTTSYLNQFDVVILGEKAVTQSNKTMLSDYVKAGGNLIAFRPDKQLSEIFGIIDAKKTVNEGYIKIDTSGTIGKGLVPVTIQFHGISDVYYLDGSEQIATLYTNAQNSTEFPSLVVNNYGTGHAAAFTYNLSKSIVYTRQGNPNWAGTERDNVDGPTPTDLFYPQSGEIQWNNPDKIAIPQADEQMRLLSHIIEKFNTYKKPLPRFWYFPDKYKCVFIFTIDGEDSLEDDINNEIIDVQSKGGNATLYEIGTYISKSTINTWISDGNEVAIHYNDVPDYANPTYFNMTAVLDTMTANFQKAYGISPKTVRNHWVVWCSKDSLEKKQFAEQAIIEEKFGLGFDCNYYQFGGNKVYPNWLGDVGHFTGSGIPMKFSDASGRILNIYQSSTQLPDETWLKENIENKCKTLIDRSLDEENFIYINANFHTWYWGECKLPGLRVLDYCNRRGVPVWNAEKVYEFIKMKDEATFTDINWSNNKLSFNLNSSLKHSNGLTFMVPLKHGDKKIKSITKNNKDNPFTIKSVKGSDYAFLTVEPGGNYSILVNYGN